MPNLPAKPRIPPRDRFAGTERVINLDQAFAELPAESIVRQGHIQKTLHRSGPTTTAIFCFDTGSALNQHVLQGEAVLHVLEGLLRVTTDASTNELGPNDLMLLEPGVPHDLKALKTTKVLLTVVLQG